MNNLRQTVLVILIGMFGLTLNAQTEQEIENTKKELEGILKEFADTYSKLPETKDKKAVLNYFSKDATSNIYVFNISKKARVQNGSVAGFSAYMDNLLRSPGIEIGYEIQEISNIHVSGSNATVSYRVAYETKVPNGIWVKGTETVTMAFEQRGDKWVIVHYNIVQFEDERLKGTCLCELFIAEADDGEVVAKTTIPNGRSYSTKFDNFEFRTVGGDQIIKVEDNVYKRLKTGPVIAVVDEEEVQLGISNSKRETVLMIIQESLYNESCAKLKTKR